MGWANLGPPSNVKTWARGFNGGMAAELHVVPHASTGGWTVSTGAGPVWFATLGEAQRAALNQARPSDTQVFLHDRYHRVRPLVARRGQA